MPKTKKRRQEALDNIRFAATGAIIRYEAGKRACGEPIKFQDQNKKIAVTEQIPENSIVGAPGAAIKNPNNPGRKRQENKKLSLSEEAYSDLSKQAKDMAHAMYIDVIAALQKTHFSITAFPNSLRAFPLHRLAVDLRAGRQRFILMFYPA